MAIAIDLSCFAVYVLRDVLVGLNVDKGHDAFRDVAR
jgi:hypothetical protein